MSTYSKKPSPFSHTASCLIVWWWMQSWLGTAASFSTASSVGVRLPSPPVSLPRHHWSRGFLVPHLSGAPPPNGFLYLIVNHEGKTAKCTDMVSTVTTVLPWTGSTDMHFRDSNLPGCLFLWLNGTVWWRFSSKGWLVSSFNDNVNTLNNNKIKYLYVGENSDQILLCCYIYEKILIAKLLIFSILH
jgi:hypothetical protein